MLSLVYVLHGELHADDFRLEELEGLEDRGEEFEGASCAREGERVQKSAYSARMREDD